MVFILLTCLSIFDDAEFGGMFEMSYKYIDLEI